MIRTFLTLVTLLVLQGCSAIKLGYQQLPTLSYWWLDNTVSFSGNQTPAAKEAIDQLFQWHRREELPGYAALLDPDTCPAAQLPLEPPWVAGGTHGWGASAEAVTSAAEVAPSLASAPWL